jgi:hypothetical protein
MTQAPQAGTQHTEEHLRGLPDHDLDALVAATFDDPNAATAVAFSRSWDGLGRILETLRARDYTVHLVSFDSSFQEDEPPCIFIAQHCANISRRRHDEPTVKVSADTFPRAAAIAAVLIHQMQRRIVTWTEERRQTHSKRMIAYWEQWRAHQAEVKQEDHG